MKKLRVLAMLISSIIILQGFAAAANSAPSANPFAVADPESVAIYVGSGKIYSYTEIDGNLQNPIANAINALPKLTKAKTASKNKLIYGFITVHELNNYEKHTYELRPNELKFDGVPYTLTEKQTEDLKKTIAANVHPEVSYAQWLLWMNPNRVTKLSYKSADVTLTNSDLSENDDARFSILENLRTVVVMPKTYKSYKGTKKASKDGFVYTLTFDKASNFVKYRIVVDGDKLYVESSDKDYGCSYTLWNPLYQIPLIRDWAEDPPEIFVDGGPLTGKPVIYLYPEKTRDVSVKLDFKGEICYTYPEYKNGWNVTASPDGTLVNKADGTTHYYLFWDGNADFNDWDFSEGFCVKGSDLQGFLQEKLPKMGLTPREYNDFITYWVPLLSGNPYNLLTFSTKQYEDIAQLSVSPKPDTVLRVHMVYKPLVSPVQIKEQVLPEAPKRSGFTMVEWGGTRAR